MDRYRILTYYSEACELRDSIICSPRMAIIYPVYGCNLACEGCLCGSSNQTKVFMPLDKLKKLLGELKEVGVKSIELCGGGEPLLHPDIEHIIKCIHNMGFSLGIMTNGTLLNPQLGELIVKYATYIRISVYENTWCNVNKKIQMLLELKRHNNLSIQIGGKLLVSKSNCDFIIPEVERLNEMGCDLISIKAKRNSNDELDDAELAELQKELKQMNIKKLSANLSKSICSVKCWMNPIHTLIDPFGEVYICCYYMGREREHSLGNAFEQRFSDIWWSKLHLEKITQIKQDACNAYDCRWHQYNELMGELFETNKVQHQFC